MSERLEDIAYDIRNSIPEIVEILQSKEDLIACVDELENRNKELEYASKYNGELNEFLQKRKLPPNTLGRHVVDVVMEHVEELEKENKKLKINVYNTTETLSNQIEENLRYKQALEEITDATKLPIIEVRNRAIKALAGEPNETMD